MYLFNLINLFKKYFFLKEYSILDLIKIFIFKQKKKKRNNTPTYIFAYNYFLLNKHKSKQLPLPPQQQAPSTNWIIPQNYLSTINSNRIRWQQQPTQPTHYHEVGVCHLAKVIAT